MASPGCQQHKPRSGMFVGKSCGPQGQTHHAGPIPGAGGAAWKAFSAPDPKKKLCPHPQAHRSQSDTTVAATWALSVGDRNQEQLGDRLQRNLHSQAPADPPNPCLADEGRRRSLFISSGLTLVSSREAVATFKMQSGAQSS